MSTLGAWRRIGRRLRRDEAGNALLEFHTVALILLIPLVYVLLTALQLQRASFGTSQAAREAGRVYAQDGDAAAARYAAQVALADQGVDLGRATTSITCEATPCLAPGGAVRVQVRADVALPFLPTVLAGAVNADVPVVAEHVVVPDAFRGPR